MPVNLDALRRRLTSALADRRISASEAQSLLSEATREGLAPEETAFLRDVLARNADRFEPGADTALRKLLETPRRDLPDPALLNKHQGQLGFEVYEGELFVDGAKETDVLQGSIANCYMVSSFAAVAHTHPEVIENAIRDNGDGTFTVKLYEQSDYGAPKQVEITVDGDLPTAQGATKPKYAKDAQAGELWVPILEKAFAQWKGNYDAIGNGGSPGEVMSALLGTRGTYFGLREGMDGDALYRQLKAGLDSGKAVVAATHGEEQEALYSGTGLYAWHAYTVLGVSEENGVKKVTLRNPWGYSEPGGNGPDDGIFQLTLAEFAKYYAGVWMN
ncbi:MAG: hypothetical protein IRZ16_21025 [Myxococcaceae bacterium]|nr:hypothetical protein [Myxococcaceae bacterium]